MHALEHNDICPEPCAVSNGNRGGDWIQRADKPAGRRAVVAVDQVASGADQHIVADRDFFTAVKLDVLSYEDPVPDNDGWSGRPVVVEIKKDARLKHAVLPEPDLVRPSHYALRQPGPSADPCPPDLPDQPPHQRAGIGLADDGFTPKPLEKF